MSWFHGNAPDSVFERHLRRDDDKTSPWIEEHERDLRRAHQTEHDQGNADHDLDDRLHY